MAKVAASRRGFGTRPEGPQTVDCVGDEVGSCQAKGAVSVRDENDGAAEEHHGPPQVHGCAEPHPSGRCNDLAHGRLYCEENDRHGYQPEYVAVPCEDRTIERHDDPSGNDQNGGYRQSSERADRDRRCQHSTRGPGPSAA